MCVLVSVYRASSAVFGEAEFYQLLLLFIQGVYKSDYSQFGVNPLFKTLAIGTLSVR